MNEDISIKWIVPKLSINRKTHKKFMRTPPNHPIATHNDVAVVRRGKNMISLYDGAIIPNPNDAGPFTVVDFTEGDKVVTDITGASVEWASPKVTVGDLPVGCWFVLDGEVLMIQEKDGADACCLKVPEHSEGRYTAEYEHMEAAEVDRVIGLPFIMVNK